MDRQRRVAMARPRFKIIPAVYLILVRGDEVLLQRRRGTGYCDGLYGLVSGHVDGGETATDALVREAKEEVGITVAPDALGCAHVMHRASKIGEWFDLFFVADRWEGELRICEPERCDDLAWHRLDDLPENMVPPVHAALERWRAGVVFSVFGWEAKG